MNRSRCSMGAVSSQGINQPPLVPSVRCHPCSRFNVLPMYPVLYLPDSLTSDWRRRFRADRLACPALKRRRPAAAQPNIALSLSYFPPIQRWHCPAPDSADGTTDQQLGSGSRWDDPCTVSTSLAPALLTFRSRMRQSVRLTTHFAMPAVMEMTLTCRRRHMQSIVSGL